VGQKVVRDLVEKTKLAVPDNRKGWKTHYAFFARGGFTEAARQEANRINGMLITLHQMEPSI